MNQNLILHTRTRADLCRRIDRLLDDLGPVEPPLDLRLVRDRLDLNLKYFTQRDAGLLQETAHRMTVGAKQIFRRPRLLAEALRKLSLKALYLPDHQRILIDSDLPRIKQRWAEVHEIGHSLIPWHQGLAFGDRKKTLSLDCHEKVEAEANYTAGRILFLGDRFATELNDTKDVDLKAVRGFAKGYGNSITTTLWRTVEASEQPTFALVSKHPNGIFNPENAIRYFIRSEAFQKQFPHVTAEEVFREIGTFCFRSRGPLGQQETPIADLQQGQHTFLIECFDNSYDVLTLGTYLGPRRVMTAVA